MNKKKIGLVDQKTSHENLDAKVSILSSWSWLIWIIIMFGFASMIIWSIFGFVRVRENGVGIIIPMAGKIFEADSRGTGILKKPLVNIGDEVKKGQIIAQVLLVDLDHEIQEEEIYLNALKNQKEKVITQINEEKRNQKLFNKKYDKSFKTRLKNARTYKKFMDSFIIKEKELSTIGAVSAIEYQKMRNNLFQTENEIAKTISDMAQFQLQLIKDHHSWEQEIFQIDVKLIEAKNKLDHNKNDKMIRQYIRAPLSGVITQVFKSPGAFVKEGEVFATIVKDGKEVQVLAFFPVTKGKRIKAGMTAYVSPTIAEKALYGTIKGRIKSIVKYPLSLKDVSVLLQDEAMAKLLCKKDTPLMGKVVIEKDSSTFSGFKWTSKHGPNFMITSGTVCDIAVIIQKRTPITLVIPYLRKFFGIGYE
jgi:HlyD family secretion protein